MTTLEKEWELLIDVANKLREQVARIEYLRLDKEKLLLEERKSGKTSRG